MDRCKWSLICFVVAWFTGLPVLYAEAYVAKGDSTKGAVLVKRIEAEKDDRAKLNFALGAFKQANGSTDEYEVSVLIDVFKKLGKSSTPVIESIVARLKENDPLYQGRGPKEVERLRGYILASLGDIGTNDQVIPLIKSELAFGYHPYLVAAAVRAGSALQAHQASLIPLFSRYLDEAYKDDYVDLDNYGNFWPLKKPTTVRQEIAQALGKIGGAQADVARSQLENILQAKSGGVLFSDKELQAKARLALERLKSSATVRTDDEHAHCADEPGSKKASVVWLDEDKRVLKQIARMKALDQNGAEFTLQKALGKPFALTFFYSRCDNPHKCSATVSHVASLQKTLENEGIAGQVSLFAITLDPTFDAPSTIRAYGIDRGVNFEGNSRFLTMDESAHEKFLKSLNVSVNYGKGLVNIHGTQLFLFDKKGRLAKLYDNAVWTDEGVVNDFKVLLKE